MNPSLLWRFLNFSRGGALAWVAVILVYVLTLFYFYESLGQAEFLETYLTVMEEMPEGMKQALGLTELGFLLTGDLYRMEIYLNMEYFSWLPLLLSIYAIFFGSGLVARDAEKGALEFLLSQPVRRFQVVITKFLVFLAVLAAVMAASVVGMLVGAALMGQSLNLPNLLVAHLQAFVLVVAVAAYASVFSVLFLNNGRALMLSGLITAALYILNFVGPALGSLQWLQKGSLFYYFQGMSLLLEGQVNMAGLVLHAAVALAALAAAVVLFERRDIVPG